MSKQLTTNGAKCGVTDCVGKEGELQNCILEQKVMVAQASSFS